jgi:hypothetical protein
MQPVSLMPMPTVSEQEVFLHALRATDRQALNRFVAERGGAQDAERKAKLKAEFNRLPLLADEGLRRMAYRALSVSAGLPVVATTWTEWASVNQNWGGRQWTMTWEHYGNRHMTWAQLVASKGEGPAYNPTSNATGFRNNANTLEMHALHLDADGVGDWTVLFQVLVGMGFAFLAHRSGGHTPELPKWRIILPLARPFRTEGEHGVLAWRTAYASARVIFGALAQLTGPGFDPATDGPHHPWFPAARRKVEHPMREVYQHHGATLDLHALLAQLPAQPAPTVQQPHQRPSGMGAPSLLQLAFEVAGLLGRELGNGKFAVVCPWNHLHTLPLQPNEAPTSSTVIFPPANDSGLGQFYCAHSCGSRHAQEVLDELPPNAVEYARACLQPQRDFGPLGPLLNRLPSLPKKLPRLFRFNSRFPR